MRLLSILLVAAGTAVAAATYTATPIGPAGGLFAANILGLNNKGEVLADVCKVAAVPFCQGPNRFSAVWSNGVFTPLSIPSGYSYVAQPAYYAINDSGAVVGRLRVLGGSNSTGLSHVFEWKNGVPSQLPDAPIPGACAGAGCTSLTNGSSTSYGINAAGHILGSTIYYNRQPGGVPNCSSYWLYDGAKFRLLPYP